MGQAPSPSPLLHLEELDEAVFINRENRFVGLADIGGSRERVHIADPGRLEELLFPGNIVLVRTAPEGSARRTRWSLMAGMGEQGWVLLNTFLHRRLAEEILSRPDISPFGELSGWKAEVTPPGRSSRFDFLLEPDGPDPTWLEVKGCTLKDRGRALFPDAPTTRGTRHLSELAELSEDGYRCSVMFLVFPPGVECFSPNGETDPGFETAFRHALSSGVSFHFLRLRFDGHGVFYGGTIPLCN